MAFKKDGLSNKEFRYVTRGLNRVIEEKGQQFIKISRIAWNPSEENDADIPDEKFHFDIRKYTTDQDGNEKMLKGVSFMTEEGPHELTTALLEEGYGKTKTCIEVLTTRADFKEAVNEIVNGSDNDDDPSFDLRELL